MPVTKLPNMLETEASNCLQVSVLGYYRKPVEISRLHFDYSSVIIVAMG
jgi:hypothetical protein